MKIGIDLRFLQSAFRNSPHGGLGGVGTYSLGLWSCLLKNFQDHQFIGFVDHGVVPPKLETITGAHGNGQLRSIGLKNKILSQRLATSKYSWVLRLVESEILCLFTGQLQDLDVFHTLGQIPPPRLQCATVTTIYDCIPFGAGDRNPHPSVATRVERQYLKRISRSDALVCISTSTQHDVHLYMHKSRHKTQVIYPGIDLATFSPASKSSASFQQLCDDLPFFLHVGVCSGRKNPHVLIDSLHLLKQLTDTPFVLMFVGPYEVNPAAKKYIQELASSRSVLKEVFFLGNITANELACLYQKAVSLVFPSLYEGFGYPPAEALACGGRCITANNSSLPEAVGEYGELVDPRSSQDLAIAMLKQLMIHADSAIPNLKAAAWAQKFSWEQAAAAHMKLYGNLADKQV